MAGSEGQRWDGGSDSFNRLHDNNHVTACRKRYCLPRIVPQEGKKRVNYNTGDARRVMEEAVSLCEVMALGYEVVFHGRRRSSARHRLSTTGDGKR